MVVWLVKVVNIISLVHFLLNGRNCHGEFGLGDKIPQKNWSAGAGRCHKILEPSQSYITGRMGPSGPIFLVKWAPGHILLGRWAPSVNIAPLPPYILYRQLSSAAMHEFIYLHVYQ